MSSWSTESSSRASTWVAQSLLSRFHGRMSAASLGRSPSRLCSVGESGLFSPRCRVENTPFLPWVLVLFQVQRHVAMLAARRAPVGTLRVARLAFPLRAATPRIPPLVFRGEPRFQLGVCPALLSSRLDRSPSARDLREVGDVKEQSRRALRRGQALERPSRSVTEDDPVLDRNRVV